VPTRIQALAAPASLVTQFCSSPIQSSPSSVWEANFSMSPRCSEMNWPRSSTPRVERIQKDNTKDDKGIQRQWTPGVTGVTRDEDSEQRTNNIREMLVDITSGCSQRKAGALIHNFNKMIMCCYHAFLGWLFIQSSCVSLHWSPAASYKYMSLVSGLLPSLFWKPRRITVAEPSDGAKGQGLILEARLIALPATKTNW